jgi:Domain of unknown function (DUF1841)
MSLFNPSREEVRQFFCEAWAKQINSGILTPLESIAAKWMVEHPEYHEILGQLEMAQATDYTPEKGQTNPFLHLAMHLSITEQVQIDQPVGIREVSRQLMTKLDSEHEAQHRMMECLGQVLWQAQRDGTPPDMQAYIEAIKQLL